MWLFDEGAGCPSCSFLVDNVGDLSHLHARDTSLAVVSRGPFAEHRRLPPRGWAGRALLLVLRQLVQLRLPRHASTATSRRPSTTTSIAPTTPPTRGWKGELPGTSAFLRDGDRVFHTYSSYARGGDLQLGTYVWLDLTALGRQEDWEEPAGRADGEFMHWVRRHDEYEGARAGA